MSRNRCKKNPRLYEINAAAWISELSEKEGRSVKLRDVPSPVWDNFRDLGFDYIWLMGIWKRSRAGLEAYRRDPSFRAIESDLSTYLPGHEEEDLLGSPYSIAGYEPDKMFGGWEDIGAARNELNSRGLGLILDFIPNHTGPDHPWINSHQDFYIAGTLEQYNLAPSLFHRIEGNQGTFFAARGKDPFFPPWPDTAQLNFFKPDMRSALLAEIRSIAKHCDGLRCDMAMLVLNDVFRENWGWLNPGLALPDEEFWASARKAVPDLVLIAEAYWDKEWVLQQLGFDFVYDKRLYDRLRYGSPADVAAHLKADVAFQERLVRFIENHDEERSTGAFTGKSRESATVLFSTIPGMKLFHYGQLEGKKYKFPVFLRRSGKEEPNRAIEEFHLRLFSVLNQPVFLNGSWELRDLAPAGDDTYLNIVAYSWTYPNSIRLVAVNLDGEYAQGRLSMTDLLHRGADFRLYDELSQREYIRNGDEMISSGLHIILPGHQAHIFDISRL